MRKRRTMMTSTVSKGGGGVTDNGKCLETGKRQNPLVSKNVTNRGHRTT